MEKPTIRQAALLKFKAQKIRTGYEAFIERYEPVIVWWGRRAASKIKLPIVSYEMKLFPQDADNAIKDLVTLRIEFECKADA